jgi:hypothetical protein
MAYVTTLISEAARGRAAHWVLKAPKGWICEVREPRRTMSQNDRLWALLSDVAVSQPQGRKHTPEDWKCIFMAACGWEVMFLEGLDGRPFPAGFRSSKLTKSQMSTLQDFIEAWGSENGVRWSNQEEAA